MLLPLSLFIPSNGIVSTLLGGLLFAFYPQSSLLVQPTTEQIEQARQVIQSNAACQDLFTPVTDGSIKLDDFGLVHLSGMPPVHFVNIWATWCAPCRAELPILAKLNDTVAANFELLNLGDSPDTISKFAAQANIDTDLIAQPAPQDILQVINAQGLPYNAVFYGENLIGTRNQAIHDEQQLGACLIALDNAQ